MKTTLGFSGLSEEQINEGYRTLIDYLSLSGSGEPTLHSKIRSIIKGIKEITTIPVAVITNGSLLCEREVREDLLRADVVLPSLDAVSPEVFMRVNRSHKKLSVESVITGMVAFREIYKGQIWLEILFCKGVNDTPEELQKMKEVVIIDSQGIFYRELNVKLRQAAWNGTQKIELHNIYGQRYIGTDLDKPVEIEIFGTPAMTSGRLWMGQGSSSPWPKG
jgi:molybdenum cofactor biosynthesis enzyme MoaA